MYCNNCGKKNTEKSKFCQFCGFKLEIVGKSEKARTEAKSDKNQSKSKKDILWEKFVEIYDADGDERKKYDSMSSLHVWELIRRLQLNGFEGFIKENADELNKQPYRTIESLKNAFSWCVLGGYRLFLTESLIDDRKIGKFKTFSQEDIIDDWGKYDFTDCMKKLSDEMGACMSMFLDYKFNGFMNEAPTAKDLSNATVEKLKTSLIWNIVFGYIAGEIENKYRK